MLSRSARGVVPVWGAHLICEVLPAREQQRLSREAASAQQLFLTALTILTILTIRHVYP